MLDGNRYFAEFPDEDPANEKPPFLTARLSLRACVRLKRSCDPTFKSPSKPASTPTTPLRLEPVGWAKRDYRTRRWAKSSSALPTRESPSQTILPTLRSPPNLRRGGKHRWHRKSASAAFALN